MTYTTTKNPQFNTIEVLFDGKPFEAIRLALKELRFRWHGVKKVWYGYATEEAVRAAIEGKPEAKAESKKATKTTKKATAGTAQNHIKFYWNGIKVDGGNLRKCYFSLYNDGSVMIHADGYGAELPRDLFDVKNETDIYTDYFDNDHAELTADHPLYKYALYAAQAQDLHFKKMQIANDQKRIDAGKDAYGYYQKEINEYKERIAKLEAVMIDPGQPTAEDLAEIDRQRTEAENARRAAEHEEELRQRENCLNMRVNGERLIKSEQEAHPIMDGKPVVLINWSEHPAFCNYEDDSLLLSVTAAENILRKLDEEQHNTRETPTGYGYYFKTKFTITGADDNGEEIHYTGRYDLGDGDGGMIQHIRAFGEWCRTHTNTGAPIEQPEETNDTILFADYLAQFIETDEDTDEVNDYMFHVFYEIG